MSQYNVEQVFSLTKEAYDRGVVAGRKEIHRVDTQKAYERGYSEALKHSSGTVVSPSALTWQQVAKWRADWPMDVSNTGAIPWPTYLTSKIERFFGDEKQRTAKLPAQ